MTSNYNSSTRAYSARGTVQPEREPELRKPLFKIPVFPLRLLNCPQKYLELSTYLVDTVPASFPKLCANGRIIVDLQKEIAVDEKWVNRSVFL